MAVLGILLCVCDQGADVSVPHLAAGRAYRGAHGGFRYSCRCSAEDGNLWIPAFFVAIVAERSGAARKNRAHPDCALAHRYYLRGGGLPDAEGYETAYCLLLGQPPWILHAWYFCAYPKRPVRQRAATDQPWHLDRSAFPDRRCV